MDHNGAAEAPGNMLPLYRAVALRVREAVEKGLLAPGSLLSEATVSAVLGTSRTPVKQALDQLVQEGLLCKLAGRGFVVGPGASTNGTRLRRDQLAAAFSTSPVRRATASWTTIYDEVEREVAAMSVFGPRRLVELRLAQAYGVSRTVAHEVLGRLERLGLIEKDGSGRWSIVPMTAERVEQIYAVRRLLEPPAIEWAATRIPREELWPMRERLVAAQERYPAVSVEEMDALEHDIHVVCIAWCGNVELVKLLRINQALLIHNKHMLGTYLKRPQLDPFLGEHAAILGRLIEQDGSGAAKAMQYHLSSALPTVLERLQRLRSTGVPLTQYVAD